MNKYPEFAPLPAKSPGIGTPMGGGAVWVKVTAEEIPAEALKPYLDPKLYADLNLPGTVADVRAAKTDCRFSRSDPWQDGHSGATATRVNHSKR